MFRVLIPIDSDADRSLRQVQFVDSLPHAATDVEVTLVHVFGDEATAEKTTVDQLAAGRQAHEFLTDHDITVRTQSRFGDPATEILHAADDVDADLIVLGGRKRSPLGSLLFGSVSQSVTLDASRPVTITGGTTTPTGEQTADETAETDVAAESGETSA
jgi:nucleotide-binding universal stress UspA family protein